MSIQTMVARFLILLGCCASAVSSNAVPGRDALPGLWQADVAHSTFHGRAPYQSGRISITAGKGIGHLFAADVVTASGAKFHFEYRDPGDGSDVPVTGNPYYDSASTVWSDERTSIRTERRHGKITGTTTTTLSQDGKSFTASSSRTTPQDGHRHTSVILWKRVGP